MGRGDREGKAGAMLYTRAANASANPWVCIGTQRAPGMGWVPGAILILCLGTPHLLNNPLSPLGLLTRGALLSQAFTSDH